MATELSLGTLVGSTLNQQNQRIKTLETETTLSTYTSSTLPASPSTGETVFVSDDSTLRTWDGSSWISTQLS